MKSHQVNGDQGVTIASASREPLPGELEQLSGTKVSVEERKNDPAVTPPQDNPAVPRDEHHGKGGTYLLVDGKRVPADENGNPLPKSKK